MILADSQTTNTLSGIVASGVIFLVAIASIYDRRKRLANKARQTAKSQTAKAVVPRHPLVLPPKAYSDPRAPATKLVPIELCRELLGSPPRTFTAEMQSYLHADPPNWLVKSPDDPMNEVFRDQERIRREGKVVWAHVVQANSNIFKPGPTDHGAEMVWSDDPYYDTHPQELATIAHELFSLKRVDQADPETATFSRMLANELIRALRLPVPRRFTGGRNAYQSSMMLTRRHLPMGYMARGLMLVWVHPDPNGGVLLVPAAYWPASLTSYWKSEEPTS
jgi:hypothetical protein